MAIVKMSKLRVVGLKADSDKVFELLTKSRKFEFKPTEEHDGVEKVYNEKLQNELASRQARVAFAIDYISRQQEIALDRVKKTGKVVAGDNTFTYTRKEMSKVREVLGGDDFFAIADREEELLNIVGELERISYERVELTGKINKINEEIASYSQYAGFPFAFDIARETRNASVVVAMSNDRSKRIASCDFPIEIEYFDTGKRNVCAVSVLRNCDKAALLNALNESTYSLCPFNGAFTADDRIAELNEERERLLSDEISKVFEAVSFEDKLTELKLLYDYYGVRCERNSLDGQLGKTYFTFILEGWTIKDSVNKIVEDLRKNFECIFVEEAEIGDDDVPPTLYSNPKSLQPFEDLTGMYTTPAYNEKDPTAIMAFWYMLIFGLMCADAVYGLLLAIACFTVLKIKKFERGMANLIRLMGMCGIFCVIWGVLLGSYMGFGIPVGETCPFSYIDGGQHYLGWFNPMVQQIDLLGLAIVIGILHLICGYLLKFFVLMRQRQPLDAILDVFVIILIIIAIMLLGADIFAGMFINHSFSLVDKVLPAEITDVTSKVGMGLLLGCIVVIFFTAGRKAKGVVGYLGGGLNGIYGLINLVSDVLSYMRIFGLALASAAIASAFNTLVQSIFFSTGAIPMYIIGGILMVVLHVFNLAIGLLGTYVHDARLQFLEFYGKFLDGDGRPFKALGSDTRYTIMN